MNFYTITFRLDGDNRNQKRYWEDFAPDRDSAVNQLCDYCRVNFFDDDLFPAHIRIIRLDEYLSVFK